MFQILSLLQMTVTLRGLLSNSVTVDLVDFVDWYSDNWPGGKWSLSRMNYR